MDLNARVNWPRSTWPHWVDWAVKPQHKQTDTNFDGGTTVEHANCNNRRDKKDLIRAKKSFDLFKRWRYVNTTQRAHGVYTMSLQRQDIASTFMQRCRNVACPLGMKNPVASQFCATLTNSAKLCEKIHDVRKLTFWHVRPTKTQINLHISAVWSVFVVRMKKIRILDYPEWSSSSLSCLWFSCFSFKIAI